MSALLFGSGMAALVYQTAWLRELRFVFGASTTASAAVLAVFMGGLGAGGLLLGARAARHERPLLFYARLELGVALAAACSPLLIAAVRYVYIAVGGTLALGTVLGTLLRIALAGAVLLVPTMLAGGTLPAAIQATERGDDDERRGTALLYGANTLGALVGCLLATFYLHELLGVRAMLFAACTLNVLVALIAWRWATRGPEVSVASAAEVEEAAPADAALPVQLVAAVVGFAFLLMELVWYRMLSPLLGGSSYTFGLILATVLLGIGAGGIAYAMRRRTAAVGLGAIALSCAVEAVVIAAPFAVGDEVAILALRLRVAGQGSFLGLVAGWAVIAGLVALPAALVSGYQFPQLVAALGRGREVGERVGRAYAWNTAGAIAGALAGGFGALPLLGAPGAWRVAVALLAVTAAVLAFRAPRITSRARVAPLVAAALALALVAVRGPSGVWRHGGIGVGRAPVPDESNLFRLWRNLWRGAVVWERDGKEGSVALATDLDTAFILNGKADGSARGDAGTQVMSGLLTAMLHPSPRRSLVIGLGSGSTAGWLAAVPSMERVDVYELEPVMIEVARALAPVNRDVLSDPKVRILLGDARELLLTTRDHYDVIFSEPSNPYRSGISSLFTREFYQASNGHLGDDGLFVQWLQGYEVDLSTVGMVYATLRSVFPFVETWSTRDGDLLLIASRGPIAHDLSTLRERVAQEPYRSALFAAWRVDDVEGVLAHYVAPTSVADRFAGVTPISTDDHTVVEFGFARSVGRPGVSIWEVVGSDDPRPVVRGGTIDLGVLGERWLTMQTLNHVLIPPQLPLPEAVRHRANALNCWVVGDFACVRSQWAAQPSEPQDPIEQMVTAEALADAASPEASAKIAAVRERSPIDADVIEALYHLRRDDDSAAAASLIRALVAYRRDPWPLPDLTKRALRLAPVLAKRRPALAAGLADALGEPFAAGLLDSARRTALLEVTLLGAEPARCADVLAPLEPHVPWTRPLLEARVGCYHRLGHRLDERARFELARFRKNEGSGITPAAP